MSGASCVLEVAGKQRQSVAASQFSNTCSQTMPGKRPATDPGLKRVKKRAVLFSFHIYVLRFALVRLSSSCVYIAVQSNASAIHSESREASADPAARSLYRLSTTECAHTVIAQMNRHKDIVSV